MWKYGILNVTYFFLRYYIQHHVFTKDKSIELLNRHMFNSIRKQSTDKINSLYVFYKYKVPIFWSVYQNLKLDKNKLNV